MAQKITVTIESIQVRVKTIIVNPTPSFNIDVWVDRGDGGIYYPGDNLYVYFRADRDCYLTLIDFPPEGGATVIFPNAYHSNNFIRGGRVYRIPAPGYDFEFSIAGPSGMEVIKAIATLSDVWLLDRRIDQYSGYQEGFARISVTVGDTKILVDTLIDRVRPIPRNNWAEDTVVFYVRYR